MFCNGKMYTFILFVVHIVHIFVTKTRTQRYVVYVTNTSIGVKIQQIMYKQKLLKIVSIGTIAILGMLVLFDAIINGSNL